MSMFTRRTAKVRTALLQALREGRGYGGAAVAAGISRRLFETWRHDDPEFAQECEDARDEPIDLVEHRLLSDALAGNTLAQLAYLRAYRPERFYRKMLVALGGDPNAPPVATAEVTGAWIYPRAALERPTPITIVLDAVTEADASDDLDTDTGGEEQAA
jgi:hypothetical protein